MLQLNVFSRSDEVDVMISPEDYSKAIGALKELMSSVCDHCHDRCVKVMTARAKVGQGHKRQTRPVLLLQGHRRF